MLAVIVFFGVTLVTAIISHWLIKRFFLASLVSSVITTVVFQLLARMQLGYMDKFWPIAVVVSLVLALGIASIAGWILRTSILKRSS